MKFGVGFVYATSFE